MIVYVSGPMTGYPDFNADAFMVAEVALVANGHHVVSPRKNGLPSGSTWGDHMRTDIIMLMGAEGVAVLPGWECSKGAVLEVHVARELGMTIMPVARWIQE